MRLLTYDFSCHFVDAVRNVDGSLATYVHDLPEGRHRNRHGSGPFVTIVLSDPLPSAKGVYVVAVDGTAAYVGRATDSLRLRWSSSQYAAIQPYNTYVGGQSTNCRLNNLIGKAIGSDARVELWTHCTEKPIEVEQQLERALRPPWNIRRL